MFVVMLGFFMSFFCSKQLMQIQKKICKNQASQQKIALLILTGLYKNGTIPLIGIILVTNLPKMVDSEQ